MRLRALLSLIMLTISQAACDPCAGVARCANGSYLAVVGQMVDPVSGVGIDGVRIDLVRSAGLPLDTDSLSTVTRDGGHWRLELSPRDSGTTLVDIVISTPGFDPYRVRRVALETHEHGGDANVLDQWVPVPYFAYAGEFYLDGSADQRVANVPVEFRQTSGVALRGEGIRDGVYRAPTDFAGRLTVFPTTGSNAVFPVTTGTIVGDFSVQRGPPYGTTVIRGVRLDATPVYRAPPIIFRVAVGPGTP